MSTALSSARVLWQRHGDASHILRPIAPVGRVAHLVIDMQAAFLAPGSPVEVPAARSIVREINAVSAAVRRAGGLNVFVRFLINRETVAGWPRFFEQFGGVGVRKLMLDCFDRGTPLFELYDGLNVDDADHILDKTRYSAFGADSNLDGLLKAQGVGTVIVSGTMSNCCCESTARDAMERNYRVLFGRDTNAASSVALHEAAVANMIRHFGAAPSASEIIAALQGPVAVQLPTGR